MVQGDSIKQGQQSNSDTHSSHLSNAETREHHKGLPISHPYLEQILDAIEDDAVFTTDKDDLTTLWNAGAGQLFGYTHEEIIGQNVALLFTPEDRNKNISAEERRAAIKDRRAKAERWHVRKDGSRFWASSTVLPLSDEMGNIQGFARIVRDFTGKKRDEEARNMLMRELETEKRKLVDVFERAPAFIAILHGQMHIFDMINSSYYQLVGHREIIGKSVREAIPEVEDQGYIALLDDVLATGQPFIGKEMKVGLQRVPGGVVEERYVDFAFEPLRDLYDNRIGIVAHGYDVTEQVVARKKAEQLALQLEQQARTFDITLAALKDFVYTFDTAGHFTYANRSLLDLLGITLDEIIGKSFHELPYPEELATLLQTQIEQVAVTGKAVTDETSFTSPAGVRGYYEYIFVPIFDDDKNVILIAGSTRDITARKQLENQKDDFMGIVSHELKTPVTSIKAFTQVLQHRFAQAGDERSTALLGKMDAQINKLTSLIGDLLDVTKIEGGKLQFNEDNFDFDELVTEIVEEIQRTTNKHTIEKIGRAEKTVFGDRDRIGQVISNMLTNAIKYSPHSEKIIVKTQGHAESVIFSVQDFGVGIPEGRQQQVFERFYRVSGNDTIPGIGLGLYISAEIIKRQNGKIWVESEPGKGTIFYFSVPVSPVQQVKIGQ